ncbi:hypothetical protein [Flavobacterium sp.]|uniref:hypothetical protein n=1 Tax=Flavobacterium sp. TaxID=239 RepID=UPI00261644F7|nr:hypothetical protein [Flavobacterium sp.]
MINTELRIGNYVEINNQVTKMEVGWFSSTSIRRIEITEKWLLDFGFEKIDNHRFKIKPSDFFDYYYTYSITDQTFRVYLDNEKTIICISCAFSVHELQNLFYSITKRELAIA